VVGDGVLEWLVGCGNVVVVVGADGSAAGGPQSAAEAFLAAA